MFGEHTIVLYNNRLSLSCPTLANLVGTHHYLVNLPLRKLGGILLDWNITVLEIGE